MEQQNLFICNEFEHYFEVVSHWCEITKEHTESFVWTYTAASTVSLRCKTCGAEETLVETDEKEFVL
jgi:hypothetical protein